MLPNRVRTENNNVGNGQISPELIEEGIKTNLAPLNEQISTLQQLLKQLINKNSAKTSPTPGSHAHRPCTSTSPDNHHKETQTLTLTAFAL